MEREKTIQPYDWSKKEIFDLDSISKSVVNFTKWSIERHIVNLKVSKDSLKYKLMKHKALQDGRSSQSSGVKIKGEIPPEDVNKGKGRALPKRCSQKRGATCTVKKTNKKGNDH